MAALRQGIYHRVAVMAAPGIRARLLKATEGDFGSPPQRHPNHSNPMPKAIEG